MEKQLGYDQPLWGLKLNCTRETALELLLWSAPMGIETWAIGATMANLKELWSAPMGIETDYKLDKVVFSKKSYDQPLWGLKLML